MQILYIIGNGFDLNLNMPTSFRNFCDEYKKPLAGEHNLLINLKKDIDKNANNWADLEKRLGEYTKRLKTFKSFEIIFDDLILKMVKYLENVEINVNFSKTNREKLFEYFSKPEIALPPKDIKEISQFKDKWFNDHWYVNIMSFNYTKTIEKLFEGATQDLIIGSHHRIEAKVILKEIYHVHGLLDDGTILGINDLSQLKNLKFHNDQRIVNSLIKPENNKSQRKLVDENCIEKISQSNIICIFGSSIGETDNFWWEKIGEQLLKRNDCELIIYTKGDDFPASLGHKKAQIGSFTKDLFLKRTKLSKEDIEKISEKIHIGVNTTMFDNLIKSHK